MSDHEKNCRLCNAIHNPFAAGDGEVRTFDKVLFKTQNFVLLPSIGPLVRGHAMVVSRKHYPSLASMPQYAIREYEDMARMFFRLPQIDGNLLEAEHGSTGDCHAGACVAHTHIHLLPGLQEHRGFLDGSLRQTGAFQNLADIQGLKQPYISLRANLEAVVLFDANAVPTQAIRRVLCGQLGRANWDWRTEPCNDLIDETISFWKRALTNAQLT